MPIKGKKKRTIPKTTTSTGPRDPHRLDYSRDDDLATMPPPPAGSLPLPPPPLDSKDYQAAIKAHLNEFDDLATRTVGLNGAFPHLPPTDLLNGSASAVHASSLGKKAAKRASRVVSGGKQDGVSRENGGGKSGDQIWNTTTTEERERIKGFWLNLGEDERKSLVRVEKEAVLKKMKEQQKHSCSCSVCGRKRTAIEEELEVLYDAYYEELEQYANRQQRFPSSSRVPSPPPPPLRSGQGTATYHDPSVSRPPRPGKITEILHSDDELGSYDDEEDEDYLSDDNYSDIDDTEDGYYEDDRAPSEFFRFGNSLTVKGGILTVADDLLKNDGKKFIEMMEQLAERRMQREEEAMLEAREFDDEDDDEDYDDEDLDSEDYDEEDEEEQDVLTEEQRMAEGRRMFQIFAARMFEQRVLTAYREKVAQERQAKLLEELEAEDTREREREAKKLKDSQKKKEKKKAQQQKKEEDRARKEADRLAAENKAKEEAERKAEEARRKKEELRLKKEAERKAAEAERLRRDEEKKKRLQEEQAKQEAALKERKVKAEQVRRDALAKEVATRDSRLKRAEAKLNAHDAKAARHSDKNDQSAQGKNASSSVTTSTTATAPRSTDTTTAAPTAAPTPTIVAKAQSGPVPAKAAPVLKSASPAVGATAPAVPRTQTPSQVAQVPSQGAASRPSVPQPQQQTAYVQTPWAPPTQIAARQDPAAPIGPPAQSTARSNTSQAPSQFVGAPQNGYSRQGQAQQPPSMPMPLPPPGMAGVRGSATDAFGFSSGPSVDQAMQPSARPTLGGLGPPGVSYSSVAPTGSSLLSDAARSAAPRSTSAAGPGSSRFGQSFGSGNSSGPQAAQAFDEILEPDHILRRTSMFDEPLGSIGRPSPSRAANSANPVGTIGRPPVGPSAGTFDGPWSSKASQHNSPQSQAQTQTQTQTTGSSFLYDSLHHDTGIDDILGSRVLNEEDDIVLDGHQMRAVPSMVGNGGVSFGPTAPGWQSFNNMISPSMAGTNWSTGGVHGHSSRYVPGLQQCRAGCRQVYLALRGTIGRQASLFNSTNEHDAPFVSVRRLHEAYQDIHPDHVVDEHEILSAIAQPGNAGNGGGTFQVESGNGEYVVRFTEDGSGSSHKLTSPSMQPVGAIGGGQSLRHSPPQPHLQPAGVGGIGAGRWGLSQSTGTTAGLGDKTGVVGNSSSASNAATTSAIGAIGQGIFQPLHGQYNPFQPHGAGDVPPSSSSGSGSVPAAIGHGRLSNDQPKH